MAGELLSPRHRELIRPVDSEHSAVFQALGGTLDASGIRRIILTASGGPFRGCGPERLRTVTPAEALAHPSWSMGPRITVDSAPLLNKGFEVIEAVRLFSVPFESVKVVIHPQSIIHSLIEHPDGSLIAQMGTPDMRLAVAYALAFPERLPLLDGGLPGYRAFSFDRDLTFEEPDRGVFRCLALAEEAGRSGGTAPSVLNAAGEVAAEAFLKGRLPFTGIAEVIEDCLGGVAREPLGSLDDALLADSRARECASELVRKYG